MAEKWVDNFYIQRDEVLRSKNVGLKYMIGLVAQWRFTQTLHLQGSGRFSGEEQKTFRHEIWRTLEDMLVERQATAEDEIQPFWCLGGQRATEADAVVFGFISTGLLASS